MSSRETAQLLVEEALGACQHLPPYSRCLELNRDLRETIEVRLRAEVRP